MKLERQQIKPQMVLRIVLLVVLLALLVLLAGRLFPATVGTSDWIGYWGATRLLIEGKNPYDAAEILRVQEEALGERDLPMFTWNPPWVVALLLPLGALPFPQATAVWVVLNMLFLGSVGLGTWWLFDRSTSAPRLCLALFLTFVFPQTITALDTGQISPLVAVGVVGFLVAYRKEQWFLAGALLVFTTVKPHLVFLWLPLVFLWTLGERRWKVWIGFGAGMAALLVVLTWFLPSWPKAYSAILASPPTDWATPTLGGVMAMTWGINWGRYAGLLFVPLTLPLWGKTRDGRLEDVSAALLTVGLPLTIFGWSYDQILLLIPLIAIVTWLVNGQFSRRDTVLTVLMIGTFVAGVLAQRLYGTNELYFFWVPLAVLFIGVWSVWRRAVHTGQMEPTPSSGGGELPALASKRSSLR